MGDAVVIAGVRAHWRCGSAYYRTQTPSDRRTDPGSMGKTQTASRQRITRPLRLRGGIASRDSAHHERPQDEWIAIPVPPIIDEQTFALAQERLEANKTHAPGRTVVPSVVQGLVSCANCGYALYRTSTRSSARTIYYYRVVTGPTGIIGIVAIIFPRMC
jgi:site-specific DNA recombinase